MMSPSLGVWYGNPSDNATEGERGDKVIDSWNNQVVNNM
jgi:hypothetical protein